MFNSTEGGPRDCRYLRRFTAVSCFEAFRIIMNNRPRLGPDLTVKLHCNHSSTAVCLNLSIESPRLHMNLRNSPDAGFPPNLKVCPDTERLLPSGTQVRNPAPGWPLKGAGPKPSQGVAEDRFHSRSPGRSRCTPLRQAFL